MLSSIHPLGERVRGNRWGVTAGFYVAGAVSGGAVVGALSGAAGWLGRLLGTPSQTAVAIAVVGLAAASAAADGFHLPVPSPERQVNETWLSRYRPWVYGGGFGFQLGTGVMTFVKTASIYLLWALAALTGSIVAGALVGAWFGLLRGSALLTVGGVGDPESLRAYFKRMARLAPAVHRVAMVTPLFAAAAALGMTAVTA